MVPEVPRFIIAAQEAAESVKASDARAKQNMANVEESITRAPRLAHEFTKSTF